MDVKKLQDIAVSQQDFKIIRIHNQLYVDKTHKIYEFFRKPGSSYFLSRPRRFGKSLLCSTLRELFLGNRELFKDLWIDHSDWEWKKHPVIHISLMGVSGAGKTPTEFDRELNYVLYDIATSHEVTLPQGEKAAVTLKFLIKKLFDAYKIGVVVIIDEYDKILLDNFDKPDVLPELHSMLRNFYGQLKDSTEFLRFVFLTGVYKFAQTSVFSGLNNIQDLTFHPSAADICGYTHEELVANFMPYIEPLAQMAKKPTPEFIEFLRERYNGYTFGFNNVTGELGVKVYNPFAINNILNSQSLHDFWFASGSPTFLIEKLKTGQYAPFDPDNAWQPFRELIGSATPENLTLNTLIYYAGYVTIKAYDPETKKILLDYPNMEVAESMAFSVVPFMTDKSLTGISRPAEAIAKILRHAEGFENLREHINRALANIPYYLFSKAEAYYQTVLLFLLHMQGLPAQAEDITNRGRSDITVIMPKAVYIFELKVDKPVSEAIEQIFTMGYDTKYRSLGKPIYGFGIIMGSEQREVIDFEVRKVQ